MRKIKCLDLFCGVGGAGEGYQRAGFEVTGVDILKQPNNPHQFIQADALDYLKRNWREYDFVHASPPCQNYSVSTYQFRKKGKKYLDLIEPLKKILEAIDLPFVIENVPLAPIRKDIYLKGYIFGLKVIRERKFELGNGLFMLQPEIYKTKKTVKNGDFVTVCGHGSLKDKKSYQYFKYDQGSILDNWRFAMGMDWAKTYKELANAIPPAYTEYIANNIKNQI